MMCVVKRGQRRRPSNVAVAMTVSLTLVLSTLAHAERPDLSGVWMPTSIGPDGQRQRSWPESPPYRPEVQALIGEYHANYNAEDDDAGRNCLPYGVPYQMLGTAQYPMEIVQTESRVTLIFELHNDVRRIYLDGRGHPSNLLPSWMGHSIGYWDGDELVVETRGLRPGSLPRPHSPDLTVTERFRLVDGGDRGTMLQVEITLHDPQTFTQPFAVRNHWRQLPNLEMGEYFCNEDLWQQNLSGSETRIPWR